MDTKTVDIRGKELHFVKRVLNRQQYNEPFSVDLLKDQRFTLQWSEDFVTSLEAKGLLRFGNGFIYVTDLAIRSINEKEKIESRLIEEQIIDDFEFAFLTFMKNRNEPVHLFDFPSNFKYHSKIDGQPVPGTTNTFYDWMDEVHKYIHDPTIDGYILNHTGEARFEKLKNEKALKAENERLDIEVKRQTIVGARFSRNVAYVSLGVAAITAFVPLFIWWADKDKTQKTETEIPQLKQVIQKQQETQEVLQNLQKTIYSIDTSSKKVKLVK
jgi:hypothetical protein